MNAWSSFFQGELGAAAALAGLLFVSISVNQARILELGKFANRAVEALFMLFLVVVVSSVGLIPGQPTRLVGAEVLAAAAATLLALLPLQAGYMRELAPHHRARAVNLVAGNLVSVSVIGLGGIVLVATGDGVGFYFIPPGMLLTFFSVAANAWVLLIEINR